MLLLPIHKDIILEAIRSNWRLAKTFTFPSWRMEVLRGRVCSCWSNFFGTSIWSILSQAWRRWAWSCSCPSPPPACPPSPQSRSRTRSRTGRRSWGTPWRSKANNNIPYMFPNKPWKNILFFCSHRVEIAGGLGPTAGKVSFSYFIVWEISIEKVLRSGASDLWAPTPPLRWPGRPWRHSGRPFRWIGKNNNV